MTNYIIMGLFLLILLIGASYKILTNKDEPLEKDILKTSEEDIDKKNEVKKRVINDHIADIMNVKKDK
jgi:hypothetical protein